MINIEKKPILISSSVSCMDLCNLENSINEVEKAGVSFLHFDIVDGQFNNCFILGESTLEAIRPITNIPIEVHLAVYNPEKYIERFAKLGADYIAVHYEAMSNPLKTFEYICHCGSKPILAFKADTPPNNDFLTLAKEVDWILKLTVNPGFSGQKLQEVSLEHIKQMSNIIKENNIDTYIQADGNVNCKTIPKLFSAGANIFTGGSSGLFIKDFTIKENFNNLLNSIYNI